MHNDYVLDHPYVLIHVHVHALIVHYMYTGEHGFHKVPVEKMFMFHQPRTDYSIHPQITTSSDTEDSSSGIVSDQPRSQSGLPLKAESGATSEQSLRGSAQSIQSSSPSAGMPETNLLH